MSKRSKRKPAPAPARRIVIQKTPDFWNDDWFQGLVIVLVVFFSYAPSWNGGFLWDDDPLINNNPCIVGPKGFIDIWTSNQADICPLTISAFWLEHTIFGGDITLPYHFFTLLLHGIGAVVLWRVLRSLLIPGAWLGAFFWALHPVQVESVAWITETKNTLSGVFYFLTILFFVKWLRSGDDETNPRRVWYYRLMLVNALLAMTAKSSTVVLPVVLLLSAWWVERRFRWRHVVALVPLFLMAVADGLVAIWTQTFGGAGDPQWMLVWQQRLAAAGDATWFYLGKLAWPHPLIAAYPRWDIDAAQPLSYAGLAAVIVVSLVLWLYRQSWARPWFLAWAYFLIVAAPQLDLVNMSFFRISLVGDHFQYLSCMGPLALAAAGLQRWGDFIAPPRKWLISALAGTILLIYAMISWQRAGYFESAQTLWTRTALQNGHSWPVYENLGLVYVDKGDSETALAMFRKAVQINPRISEVHNNLGNALLRTGDKDAAIAEYKTSIANDPKYPIPHLNMARAYNWLGQTDTSLSEYAKAAALGPDHEEIYRESADILSKVGRQEEAIANYRHSLKIDPRQFDIHNKLGILLAQNGHLDEGISELREAIRLNPTYAQAYNNLGNALYLKGSVDDAIAQFETALRLQPDYAGARGNLEQIKAAVAKKKAAATPAPGK